MSTIPHLSYLLILCVLGVNRALKVHDNRASHLPSDLSQSDVQKLANMGNTSQIDDVLDHILVPRVVGTKSHKKVKNYIVAELTRLGFTVEVDSFEDQTPVFGKLRFSNIIGRLVPSADRFLTLACHYDSKYTREYDFIGATDSGVPCAMMLNLANQMKDLLKTANPSVSLKLVFFDGEEAFHQWGPSDSIYGARHLAAHWSNKQSKAYGQSVTELDRIDLLILLDLLGTPDPKFYSYFTETEKWYVKLAQAEERLSDLGELKQYSKGHPQQTYFAQRSIRAHIEDDHIPFLRRGVPILHVIPTPFPDVWHTERDNRNAVDMHTVENLNKILRVFVAEYLHLKI